MYLPFADGNALGNLSTVSSVVHEEHLDVTLVADEHLLEAIGKGVSGLVVLLVSDLHLLLSASESPSGRAIDTSHLSVGVWVNSLELVRLESSWYFSDLLNNLSPVQWSGGHNIILNKEYKNNTLFS